MDNTERVLDWVPKHDPRSLEYPVSAVIRTAPRLRNKLWRIGPILDQGREGACVGFGWTAEALSTPIAVDLSRLAKPVPSDPTQYALSIYRRAKQIDEWAGENYDGTSVLAGVKVQRENGLVKEFRWAFDVQDVINTVLTKGPVVIGIDWHYDMYWAPNGVLKPTGAVVGGHCLTVVGFVVNSPKLDGENGFILQNSWGNDWGINGLAEIKVSDLEKLLAKYGEACVATKRSYGRAPKNSK